MSVEVRRSIYGIATATSYFSLQFITSTYDDVQEINCFTYACYIPVERILVVLKATFSRPKLNGALKVKHSLFICTNLMRERHLCSPSRPVECLELQGKYTNALPNVNKNTLPATDIFDHPFSVNTGILTNIDKQ